MMVALREGLLRHAILRGEAARYRRSLLQARDGGRMTIMVSGVFLDLDIAVR